jgi:itaconyl-CoA hydratase
MECNKYGDDFNVGDLYTTPSVTVTETHVVNWASLTMDHYPLHTDAVYAAKSSFGERLAHGPLIFGLAVGLVYMAGIFGDSVIAWLGVDDMRMLKPVKFGDTITVVAEVIGKRTTSKPEKGVQIWRYSVKNQREETVLVFDYKLMFRMRV